MAIGRTRAIWESIASLYLLLWGVLRDVLFFWLIHFVKRTLYPNNERRIYLDLLDKSTSYEQWSEAAARLDTLEGRDEWKKNPASLSYDYEMIQERLAQLKRTRDLGDLSAMMFVLRTSLSRNLGDMGNPNLYSVCRFGTKELIENYIDEVIDQLHLICDMPSADLTSNQKLEFFQSSQRAFGRTGLLLSGGGTFGLLHVGVIKTLHHVQLLPRIISGASVGSIIAAVVCSRTDAELDKLLTFEQIQLDVFERPEEHGNIWLRLIRVIEHSVLYDVGVFQEAMKANIGDLTFQEAYNRTRRILNITVSSSTTYEMPRLLNHLTAPNVVIWSAVVASCAVPFLYKPAPLMAKDPKGRGYVPWNPSGHRWIDGSVENDLPMSRLSEMFNVNHFIVCQVNPHVVPFLRLIETTYSPLQKAVSKAGVALIAELQHYLKQLIDLGVVPGLLARFQQILMQKYFGDITIVPKVSSLDYSNIVSNPSAEHLAMASVRGENATWPHVSVIKNHCRIELAIDEIIHKLKIERLQQENKVCTRPTNGSYAQKHETIGSALEFSSGFKFPFDGAQYESRPSQIPDSLNRFIDKSCGPITGSNNELSSGSDLAADYKPLAWGTVPPPNELKRLTLPNWEADGERQQQDGSGRARRVSFHRYPTSDELFSATKKMKSASPSLGGSPNYKPF